MILASSSGITVIEDSKFPVATLDTADAIQLGLELATQMVQRYDDATLRDCDGGGCDGGFAVATAGGTDGGWAGAEATVLVGVG